MTSPRTPDPIPRGFAGHPAGLGVLFFTELWERFSYYGMRALLVLFLSLPVADGGLGFTTAEASRIYGTYTMAVYLLSIPGGFFADRFCGARRAVLWGGTVIACGHFCLAAGGETLFFTGLALIILGTGLFKPNISAIVGGLYAPDDPRRDAGFSIFYMGINAGALAAPLVTGFLAQSALFRNWLEQMGFDPLKSWHWGFGAAGAGMTIAVAIFALFARPLARAAGAAPPAEGAGASARRGLAWVLAGTAALFALATLSDLPHLTWMRGLYVAVPAAAAGILAFRGSADARRIAAILILGLAAMAFFAIFEQMGSSLTFFADRFTRTDVFGFAVPSSWFQSLNPLFVILLTPLFAAMWMRLGARQPSAPVKFAAGLTFLALSFLLMVPAAHLTSEGRVSPLWLAGFYLLLTTGELFLSPVGLSAMTRLAPARLTGFILGLWFLAMAFGNKLAGAAGEQFSSATPASLTAFFGSGALAAGAAAALLLTLSPWVKRLMGGVR